MVEIVDKLAWTCIRNRRVLFARTRGEEQFYNVGGKRKDGETDIEALCREVEEETGIKLARETIRHLKTFSGPCHGKPNAVLKMSCYTADGDREPTPSAEIEEFAWFTSKDFGRTTAVGQTILLWLRERNLID